MNELYAYVARVEEVEPHPHADRLDLAYVDGLRHVVARGSFKPGDLAFRFTAFSELQPEYVKQFGIEQYYKKFIRAIRIRGCYSFALLVPVSEQPRFASRLFKATLARHVIGRYKEGDDVSCLWS